MIIRYTLALLLMATNAWSELSTKPKIFISKTVDHPAIDATTNGIIDELSDSGYIDGKTIELKISSAQANAALAQQIANQYLSDKPDIVVGVATISAQAFAKAAANGKVKLVFSTVTDPLSAGLVNSLDKPGRNTSGVSNFVKLEPQLELFKKSLPKMTKLGIIYNPGESNSLAIVKNLEVLCPKFGLTLVPQTANKTSEAAQATAKLAENADAIFISNDNTALAALPSIIKTANARKVPVFVSDVDAVELGAMAALGPSQYEVGRQTGRMIIRVLKGEDINNQPVEFPAKTELKLGLGV